MTQNSHIGTWKLVSFEIHKADGQVSYPYGKDAEGYLIYTEDGYMSVAFMNPNRPMFKSGDPMVGTREEKVAAFESYIGYGGPYEIQEDRVIHHIKICSFPNYVGADKERFFDVERDRLILRSPPILWNGIQKVGIVKWERYLTI